jgi:hypothetical protein
MKCPWCSKDAPVRKGRLASHLTPGGIRCVGIGQPSTLVAELNRMKDASESKAQAEAIGRRK